MNTQEFFGEVVVMGRHDGGQSPRMRGGGSGDEGSLPICFGGEFILFDKTHLYGGSFTSHFMEEHLPPTSKYCRPWVRNISLFVRKLECIARRIYFYMFFGMLNKYLYL